MWYFFAVDVILVSGCGTGVPNTLNVLSNFPFLIAGVMGFVLTLQGIFFNIRSVDFDFYCFFYNYCVSVFFFLFLWVKFGDGYYFGLLGGIWTWTWSGCSFRGEVWGWALFYAGITGVAFGSSYYHLKPDDDRVMWDTLPVRISIPFNILVMNCSISWNAVFPALIESAVSESWIAMLS